MLKPFFLLAIAVTASVAALASQSPTTGQLTEGDLAKIRGAATPGCVESQWLANCMNPSGPQFSSSCEQCSSVAAQVRATSTHYPTPGACPTTGTGFLNNWYKQCAQYGPNNGFVCPPPNYAQCTWGVTCNSGVVMNDKKCGADLKCSVAAPPEQHDVNGEIWEERWACRDCSTGAPNGAGIVWVAFNACTLVNP